MPENIAISFIFGDDVEAGKVPSNSSCKEVQKLWEQLTLRSAEQHCFNVGTRDGPELSSDGYLPEFVHPEAFTATIFVHQVCKITASLVGAKEVCSELTTSSLITTEQLIAQVRSQLNIDCDRRIRFMVEDRIISFETDILRETFSRSLQIDLELQVIIFPLTALHFNSITNYDIFPVVVNEDFSAEVCKSAENRRHRLVLPLSFREEIRLVQCFNSDLGKVLLPKEIQTSTEDDQYGDYRITTINRKCHASMDMPLANLLSDNPLTPHLAVFLESKMVVHINNRILGERCAAFLWPSSPLSSLLEEKNQRLMIDGQQADPEQSLWASGLHEGAEVVITELVTLYVTSSSRQLHTFITDHHQSGEELHQRVTQFEDANNHFRVWFDGRCLSRENRTLAQLGVTDESKINLIFRTRCVEVQAKSRRLATFDDVCEGTTFQQFLSMMSEKTSTSLPEDTSFHCKCGRIFSSERPLRCLFPLRCCDAAPLRLEMRVPQQQHFHGRWVDSDFRLPNGGVSDVLEKLSRLATCDRGKEWQQLEEALVQSLLTIQSASEVRIRLHERLDLLLQLSNDISLPWSVRPSDSVCTALTDLESRTYRSFADLAVRGNRSLKARERSNSTFADFGVVPGQRLTVIDLSSNGKC